MKNLLLFVGLVTPGIGQSLSAADAPFALNWATGSCVGCKIAQSLTHVQFTARGVAWAIGVNFAEEAEGTGDYVVVRTKDGGRRWVEDRNTLQHAIAPAFSFADTSNGWIALSGSSGPRMIRTRTGGDSWDFVSRQFAQKLQFFDGENGYGAEAATFLRTPDGGRTWSQSKIPDLNVIDQLLFLSPKTGWIAGTSGRDFLVFQTNDGGMNWNESRTATPDGVSDVRDMFFLNPKQGWLVTWRNGKAGSYLFSTADGGKTWIPEQDTSFQGNGKWASAVRFLSRDVGFIFETEQQNLGGSKPGALRPLRSTLVYTSDGGTHWNKWTLPYAVFDCQIYEGSLRCSAGSERSGFRLLTVSIR